MRKITSDIRDDVVFQYEHNTPIDEIADYYGITTRSVRNILQSRGVITKQPRLSKASTARLAVQLVQGDDRPISYRTKQLFEKVINNV